MLYFQVVTLDRKETEIEELLEAQAAHLKQSKEHPSTSGETTGKSLPSTQKSGKDKQTVTGKPPVAPPRKKKLLRSFLESD